MVGVEGSTTRWRCRIPIKTDQSRGGTELRSTELPEQRDQISFRSLWASGNRKMPVISSPAARDHQGSAGAILIGLQHRWLGREEAGDWLMPILRLAKVTSAQMRGWLLSSAARTPHKTQSSGRDGPIMASTRVRRPRRWYLQAKA